MEKYHHETKFPTLSANPFMIDNNKPVEQKKYIPPANHPWRTNMMLKKKRY